MHPWTLRASWLAAALFAVGAALAAPAEEPTAEGLLEALQTWLDGTENLRARFEQELVSGALGQGVEESGRLFLARPGKMRWNYEHPEIKVALIEGDRARLYVAEDRQMSETSIADTGSLLPALLAGSRPLADVFSADLLPPAQGRGPYRLRLLPRMEDQSLEEVVVVIRDPSRVRIEELELLDAAGNRLHYRFTDLVRNEGLPPDTFGFEPPPGTEILRD